MANSNHSACVELRNHTMTVVARLNPTAKWSPQPQDSIKMSQRDTNLQLYYYWAHFPHAEAAASVVAELYSALSENTVIKKHLTFLSRVTRNYLFCLALTTPPSHLVGRINHFTANCNTTPRMLWVALGLLCLNSAWGDTAVIKCYICQLFHRDNEEGKGNTGGGSGGRDKRRWDNAPQCTVWRDDC